MLSRGFSDYFIYNLVVLGGNSCKNSFAFIEIHHSFYLLRILDPRSLITKKYRR